jgi:non-heme chloroperoxidase
MAVSREAVELQPGFDPVPANPCGDVHVLDLWGRAVRYIDAGEPGWRPVVFFGGLGTSVGAFALTEFARTMRERLSLRVISVERNGFGETPLEPSLGYRDGVDDVLAVLDALGIERCVVVALSGGGPFAAALCAHSPERVVSLHLGSAAAGASAPLPVTLADPAALASDRAGFWELPADSPVRRIPGFLAAAAAEGQRALGCPTGTAALAHELRLLRQEPLPSLDWFTAPAYLYWGAADEVVPRFHPAAWRRALRGRVTERRYDGEGHDAHYRHWDQILVDAAGLGPRTLICLRGRTLLAQPGDAEPSLAAGATLGLCGWTAHAPRPAVELGAP